MKKLQIILFNWAAPALLSGICLSVSAQKLPTVQKTSLRAPSNIKMDGKATEWDNKFQAYNNATNAFYTLSNDNNNLYLTVQADEQSVINKILRGGITLTIQKSGKKTDKDGMSITYPVFGTDRPRISFKAMPQIVPGSPVSVKQADSFMYANNKLLAEKSKNIITRGIKDIDTLISVYNEDGIKVAEAFDNKMVYTCELAIDLKHLGLSVDNGEKFTYNFRLNGINLDDIMKNMMVVRNADGTTTVTTNGASGVSGGAAPVRLSVVGGTGFSSQGGAPITISTDGGGRGLQSLSEPTDFWGEYTLAKK